MKITHDTYRKFERYIKKKNQYYLKKEHKDFLEYLLNSSKKRSVILNKNSLLWRAQIGHSWKSLYEKKIKIDEIPAPYPKSRMIPQVNAAREGRANPKGIPFLYLATDKETSMSEVRPWIGSYLTVASFILLKDLKIVDFSRDNEPFLSSLFGKIDENKIEKLIWSDINRAFARPIENDEKTAEYTPTQIIAEFFKNNGFDGIGYKSSLSSGYNIALFNIKNAEPNNLYLYYVDKINFEFSQQY